MLGAMALSAQTIDFTETRYDYGTIKEDDGVAYHEFTFTNNGDAPLIIKKVNTSCGCTTPQWSKEPVAPGKSGIIKVGYNPSGRPNKFSKTITVFSNAPKSPTTVLQILGTVAPHVKTIDEIYHIAFGDIRLKQSHIGLGRLLLGSTRVDTVLFLNKGLTEAAVSVAPDNRPFISFKVEPKKVKPNEMGRIIITYLPAKREEWGFVNNRFSLVVNGQPVKGNSLSVSGTIEEDFSKLSAKELENAPKAVFNTTSYDFGANYPQGQPVEFDFVLTNQGKSDLLIRKVKASCGCTTAQPTRVVLKPGEQSVIKATFRTHGYTGRQTKSITVITNDPKQSNTLLRISGTVVQPAQPAEEAKK